MVSDATTVCIFILRPAAAVSSPWRVWPLYLLEVVPGIEINRLTDIALKITGSLPGEMIVERRYGMLEIHSFEQEEVLHAGQMILDELDLKVENRLAPAILTTSVINKVDPYQAVIINRNSSGMLILGGDDVYLLEVTPAAYSSIAANEAEKHCNIRLVDIRFFWSCRAGLHGRKRIRNSGSGKKSG